MAEATTAPTPAKLQLLFDGQPGDAAQSLGNIFRSVLDGAKTGVIGALSETPLAKEAKAAEIKKMLPWIILGAVALVLGGIWLGRK